MKLVSYVKLVRWPQVDTLLTGHLSKPKSCPVCDHEPLSAEDCKPHKTSRLTVRAYLKAEEKKREKVKQDAAAAAATAEEGSNPTATTDPEVTTTPAVEVTAATQDGAAEATLNHDETTPLNGNLTSDALESLDIANGHSAEANAEDGSDTASSAGSSVEVSLEELNFTTSWLTVSAVHSSRSSCGTRAYLWPLNPCGPDFE